MSGLLGVKSRPLDAITVRNGMKDKKQHFDSTIMNQTTSPLSHHPSSRKLGSTTRFTSPSGGSFMQSNLSAVHLSPNSKQPLLDMSRMSGTAGTSVDTDRKCPSHGCSSCSFSYGLYGILSSLAFMCLLSLLMAFLALHFLQRTAPLVSVSEDAIDSHKLTKTTSHGIGVTQSRILVNAREYVRVSQISVALITLTISLNLCCLFVCCIQFLSAVKLLKTHQGTERTFEFLKKTSHVRITAIGAFLVSIPILFTGVILFTFINCDEIPALVTSLIIGIGILFCGVASVQNVYLWQWEKTKSSQGSFLPGLRPFTTRTDHLPQMELSTLV